jgi:hypothetical protein
MWFISRDESEARVYLAGIQRKEYELTQSIPGSPIRALGDDEYSKVRHSRKDAGITNVRHSRVFLAGIQKYINHWASEIGGSNHNHEETTRSLYIGKFKKWNLIYRCNEQFSRTSLAA